MRLFYNLDFKKELDKKNNVFYLKLEKNSVNYERVKEVLHLLQVILNLNF